MLTGKEETEQPPSHRVVTQFQKRHGVRSVPYSALKIGFSKIYGMYAGRASAEFAGG